jgi:hypothetical protein
VEQILRIWDFTKLEISTTNSTIYIAHTKADSVIFSSKKKTQNTPFCKKISNQLQKKCLWGSYLTNPDQLGINISLLQIIVILIFLLNKKKLEMKQIEDLTRRDFWGWETQIGSSYQLWNGCYLAFLELKMQRWRLWTFKGGWLPQCRICLS